MSGLAFVVTFFGGMFVQSLVYVAITVWHNRKLDREASERARLGVRYRREDYA